MYAIQARKHIVAIRKARPDISIEIRCCLAHKGLGNEKADEWAKLVAEEPDTHGVEWMRFSPSDRNRARTMPLSRSLAHLKRDISEKKWAEARRWAGARVTGKKYKLLIKQRPDGTVAGSPKRLASRFYQLKTGHCLTGQYLNWTKLSAGGAHIGCRHGSTSSKTVPAGRLNRRRCGPRFARGKDWFKIRDLADDRCSQAVLDFLSTTDVGRLVPAPAEEDAQSEASEWEFQERREKEEERRQEAEELGAE
jgi:hypothetical protein